MSQLGIAMIGCGGISRAHIGAYNQVDDVRVVAVADLDEERREKAKADVGAKLATADADEAIGADGVDIVDVCLPSHLHALTALAAFSAGKHVFCEKPIALDLETADGMIAAAAESHRQLAVGYVIRFDAKFQKVRELVQGGAIGRPAMFRVSISGTGPLDPGRAWYMDAAKGGGPLIDKATHLYDFACYTFGEPESVYAVTPEYRTDCTAVDTGAMILKFRSGDSMTLYLSWGLPEGVNGTYDQDLVGPGGRIQLNAAAEALAGHDAKTTDAVTVSGRGGARHETFPKSNRMVDQFQDFFGAIREGRAPLNDGAGARCTLAIALGIIESGKTGKVVAL